ncbi:MAG: hypothetical protein KGJ23_09470 [Euryarchaeota archaeon]|nr:hypothetical protein [Euryarchaeota archaeon]MDE1836831.1 hypothetical protein [Euryarchaeota archaeon]MDE1882040.1 hypothetical protein [Euryarchaeota archaeon]MDE2044815.1 hypothetical protein [Thermoplasmata archaeon]
MGAHLPLPSELSEFLSLPGPQSLLLRGSPGSGKTTLSISLLQGFQGKRVLVTSRVSAAKLEQEFPWLGESGHRSIEVIDTTGATGDSRSTSKAEPRIRELLTGAQPDSEDLRRFLWLPGPMQQAWGAASESAPTIVVVDSWDALVESYLGGASKDGGASPSRVDIERILLERMGSAPIHLVLLLEREGQTPLDYLVNGVVHLKTEFQDERLERWLIFHKLRGIRIANAMYPFSLEGGKFECIEPMRHPESFPSGRAEPEPDAIPGHIWPGSSSYADGFGRLPLGSITMLELDSDVPQSVPYLLFSPTVAQVAGRGGSVLILPDTDADPEVLWGRVQPSLSQRKYLDHVRFVTPTDGNGASTLAPTFDRTLIHIGPTNGSGGSKWEEQLDTFLGEGEGQGAPGFGLFHLSGIHGLTSAYKVPVGPDMIERLPSIVRRLVRDKAMHTVLVGRSGDRLLEALRRVAPSHIRVRMRQGRILLHGRSPWTPTFLLAAGQDHVPYELLRVV